MGHESNADDTPITASQNQVKDAAFALDALENRLARVRESVNQTGSACEYYRKAKKWSRASDKVMNVESVHRDVLRLLGELDTAVIAWHGEMLYAIDDEDKAALGGGDDKD